MNVSRTLYCCLLSVLFLAGAVSAWGQSFRRAYQPLSSYCRDVVETADGGFLMVGAIASNNNLFLQRTDLNGTPQWTKHQFLNGAYGIAVCRAADGGFAVLCEDYLDAGDRRNLLLKIDANGNTQWQQVLVNPSLSNGFQDVAATAGGGFAVAGYGRTLTPVQDFHARLLRLDDMGNLVWEQTPGAGNTTTELAQSLIEMPNGDLVVAGDVRGSAPVLGESDFFLARCDAQGSVLWQQNYPQSAYQRAYDLLANPDGSLVVFGETYQTNPVRTTFLKTDGNGSLVWTRITLPTFHINGGAYNTIAHRFTRDNAANLYVPFYLDDNGSPLGLSLFKLSASGDSSWIHTSDLTDIPEAILFSGDQHFVIAGQTGSQAMLVKSDWLADSLVFFNTLSGVVYWDENTDCTKQSGESAPPQFIVEAENQFGEVAYQSVLLNGQYSLSVTQGNYSLIARPMAGTEALWSACDTPVVSVGGTGQNVQAPDLGLQSAMDCPYLEVELGAGPIRRCTTANYTVQYCNFGTITASDAYVELTVHPYFSYVSSTVPLSTQNGDTYTFDVSNVPPGDCDYFYVKFLVSCDAEMGAAYCAEAHIYPDSSCTPQTAIWDGSHLEVSAVCNGDAVFTIKNTGADMAGTVDYVIIEDQIMYMQGPLQLDAGADSSIILPNPKGSSYYVRADQRPGHPGQSHPAAVVDMCNGQPGSSLALQLPLNQDDPFLATYCAEVTGSYDPNDKRGFPLGWRDEHYLERGQDIDYMIRFQNTGTDTAFLVIIRDTLPAELAPATVRPGASSHLYTFTLNGEGVLQFTFANILLPDSTTDEAASHGFVKFRVSQKPDLADGTVIENRAAIYFDFNAPVITNAWFHTIGHPLVTVVLDRPVAGSLELSVFPNPSSDYADFRLDQQPEGSPLRLRLFDALGQTLRTDVFSGSSYRFQRNGLAPGLYFFRLEDAGGKTAGGKLILR